MGVKFLAAPNKPKTMNDSPVSSSNAFEPSTLFEGEILTQYRRTQERVAVSGAIAICDDHGIGASYPPELAAENDPRPGIDAFLNFVSGKYHEVFRGYQLILEKL